MKVQILGSGCEKCKKLFANVESAAKDLGLQCDIEKVTDINKITAMGVMMTPALAIDGNVVSIGKVLSEKEAAVFLKPSGASKAASDPEKTVDQEEGQQSCCCGSSEDDPGSKTACCSDHKDETASGQPLCCCGSTEKDAGAGSGASCCSGGKKLLTLLLLLFVGFSLAALISREFAGKSGCPLTGACPTDAACPTGDVAVAAQTGDVAVAAPLTVYYFHGNIRCLTCNKFERLTKEVIETSFAPQLAAGSLVYKPINVDEKANEHFVKTYALTTKSVVLQRGDKHVNLDQIWTIIRQSDEAFKKYIEQGIKNILEVEK